MDPQDQNTPVTGGDQPEVEMTPEAPVSTEETPVENTPETPAETTETPAEEPAM